MISPPIIPLDSDFHLTPISESDHASMIESSNHYHNDSFSYHPSESQNDIAHHFDPSDTDGVIIGNPAHEMQFWHRQSSDDCDVVSVQMGLESLSGHHFSEQELLHESIRDGSYQEGTSSEYIGHLYETHGFPIERHHNATFGELTEQLSEGRRIVVAINSDVLWNNQDVQYGLAANHSVEVIGIVYRDNLTEPYVVLNDPGIDNGQGIMVSLSSFEKAWETSHNLIASAGTIDAHHSMILKDSYDAAARGQLLANQNSMGVPSSNDSYQFEVAAQRDAEAMREREHAEQLAQERAREESARQERAREEQRQEMLRQERLREDQQRNN